MPYNQTSTDNLLERYLNAVAEHLPAAHRADTLAELRANLIAEIEAREDALSETDGRPLNDADIAAILEAHGMPVLVAARYGAQQYLIGPQLFPFYWYTLRRSLPWVIALYTLAQVGTAITRSDSGPEFGQHIAAAVFHFPMVALIFWAIMTLGFAVFEFAQGRLFPKVTLPKWSAADLPPVVPAPPKDLSTGHIVADVIFSILTLAWLLMIPTHPFLIIGPGARILHGSPFGFTPEWRAFYWQIVTLLAIMLPLKAMMLLPSMLRFRQHIQLAVNAIGVGILAIMVTVRIYFVPNAVTLSEMKLHDLAGINQGITAGFQLALVLSILKWLWDAFQLIRNSTRNPQSTNFAPVK